MIGRTAREAFPELVQQGFVEKLDKVYQTGEPFFGMEVPFWLDLEGGTGVVWYATGMPDERRGGRSAFSAVEESRAR